MGVPLVLEPHRARGELDPVDGRAVETAACGPGAAGSFAMRLKRRTAFRFQYAMRSASFPL